MKYIKKFNQHSLYEAFIVGAEFIKPNLCLCVKENEVHYTQYTPSYNVLDILYANSNGDKKVTSNILDPSEGYIPIGICVVPTDFYGNGELSRFVSLKYMSCMTPDSGSFEGSTIYYGNLSYDITTIDNIQKSYVNGSDDGYLSDVSVSTPSIPSIFDSNNRWNLSILGDKNLWAVTDVDGKTKTNKMLETATAQSNWRTASQIKLDYNNYYTPCVCCCWRYHTLGTQQGDWYLGACGEMLMIIINKIRINSKLSEISALYPNYCLQGFANIWYLTSTKFQMAYPWLINLEEGRVKKNYEEQYYVLATLQY